MAVLGGVHTFLGPALGAAVYVVLEVLISGNTEYWPLAMGVIIVALVLLMPEGLERLPQETAHERAHPARRGRSPSASAACEALGGVDLSVARGDFRAIIGPNGAGKSTFFNTMTGLLKPDAGRVAVRGTRCHRRAAAPPRAHAASPAPSRSPASSPT